MKHKHAENMLAYAQDAMETHKPWERWERHDISNTWITLVGHPNWHAATQYRRKPRTININGFDVPEPVREPLEDGQEYYIPSITFGSGAGHHSWRGDNHDDGWLAKGLIHLTQEAAEIHAKALLSFTKTQP